MHIHARCNFDPDAAAITNARGARAPKTVAIACFAGAPRMLKASQNGAFEAFGGQVGQEHVIAAHLDGEGTAFSAPSEAKRMSKEDQF